MKPIIRNFLGIIAGWIAGSTINIGLIQLGYYLIPIPGIDPSDMEALAETMPTLDFQYFIFPFLAHALGTLVGALVTGLIVRKYKLQFAIVVGALFLIGGVVMSYMLPAPVWFTTIDLIFAYIPMALLGGKIAHRWSS